MYNNKLPHQQLTAWLAAAIVPTAVQLIAGASWLGVLLASLVTLLCIGLVWQWGAEPKGKLIALLQWGLLTAVLSALCRQAPGSWPEGGHKAVALILLALALWAAWKGTSASARVGCVLFWFVLLLYLIVLGAGMKEVELRWLKPGRGEVSALCCILLLTPAAAFIHLNKRERCKPRLLLIGLFCTVAAAVTAGVLSPQVSANLENPFFEMTRSLNLLGQARRFEALLSAGMTVGWFSLINLQLTLCSEWANRIRTGWAKPGMIAAALVTTVSILLGWSIPGSVLLILAALLWVLLPLILRVTGKIKKSK